MFDIIKKTMLSGLEVASLTKEKVGKLSKELVEKGKLTKNEGKKLFSELLKKSADAKKGLNKQIEVTIKNTLKKMNIATKDDIMNLEKKLKALKDVKKKKVTKKN